MKKFNPFLPVPEYQAAATLNQAAPVQNTYYTILDTTLHCRIWSVSVLIATTGEDLNLRITIDGEIIVGTTLAAANDTNYYMRKRLNATGMAYTLDSTDYGSTNAFQFEGRSVKIEVRKTTANGAGNLKGCVAYSKY